MRCFAVVKYLRIVGSIYNRPWIKKICRHCSFTEYGDEEYNLEAEMPCLEGKPQEETGWPLDLAGSCRTWLIELINHRSNMKWFLIIVLDKSSCSMLNHINLVNITFSFNEGFHAELVYSNCKRTPPPTPTVHFDNKSNMADGINDRELITIAHPDETLALQATQ